MTSSLIPERPLLISPTLAATIGLEEAVLLHVVSELLLQHPPLVRQERRFAAISEESLLAALPFWRLADIKRVQQSLQGLGLLLIEAVPDEERTWLIAINQPTSATRQRVATASRTTTMAKGSNAGVATRLPANWQPDATLYQQCAQRNIPSDFIERELAAFVLYQRDRGKAEYSWQRAFLSWVISGWEKQRSTQQARTLEAAMTADWLPSEDAISILEHGGIQTAFIETAVPEYVLYWRNKGTVGNEWDSRFIAHVRRQWERYQHALENDTTPRPIPANFTPSQACYDVLGMANIDLGFAESQLPEFVMYWQDRNEAHGSWNKKFLQHVKFKWAQQSQVGQTLLSRITDRSWAD